MQSIAPLWNLKICQNLLGPSSFLRISFLLMLLALELSPTFFCGLQYMMAATIATPRVSRATPPTVPPIIAAISFSSTFKAATETRES